MQLIDTHTHLYLPEFDADRDEIVTRAVSNGVVKMLMPNIDFGSVVPMLAATRKYKDICHPMIGLHPTSVNHGYLAVLKQISELANRDKYIAVGEIGIDLYWDKTFFKEQVLAFRQQVALAISYRLPVVIHSRNSIKEVFSVLDEFSGETLTGVFHAFSGNIKDAIKAVGNGFKLGIGGPVTFKNSTLPDIVREIGLQNIVLETDSPYLAPVPFRGKRNESYYLCIINRKLAEIFGTGEEEVARITFENSCRLFNI
ncbi:MAG TPA: TatD family hydrolase [Bacteroidales bacterium]|jgi:TatD DNase family protein|nr:YchF/TatD family DNA exonuclease [Bacteroidales bacterium]OQB62753.1 MAG: putative deoxyribonuclease YjjV [Bacteroidetes bacterium ADurb.Bin145]NMD03013.1 TatD family hydrolase [Bacteroidales bacterium]HOU01983.1 TatD family hydrolase [Bacteroidales bacterium]HQG62322.1 TatD family hydrolase [Bacteroidales bacterium]